MLNKIINPFIKSIDSRTLLDTQNYELINMTTTKYYNVFWNSRSMVKSYKNNVCPLSPTFLEKNQKAVN